MMRERADAIVSGAAIMMHAVGARSCIIALEDDKPEAFESLHEALTRVSTPITVTTVPAKYPQGGERQLIRAITGAEVPYGQLPLDIGIVCNNIGTAAAVDDAVMHGRPLVSRVVTVTGGAVVEPRNVEALFGTPINELIATCGGYHMAPERLLMGGPMMGYRLADDRVPVVKGTNCIIAAAPGEFAAPAPAMPCIRCGECVSACPADLLPQQLHWATRSGDLDGAERLHLFDCIECGCCDVVCPSHIPLVDTFRWAKGEVFQRETERRKADLSKRRHDARVERIEEERREREEKLKAKRSPEAIAAAMERIKQRDEAPQ
jgi:electron transport complex protein RnfC